MARVNYNPEDDSWEPGSSSVSARETAREVNEYWDAVRSQAEANIQNFDRVYHIKAEEHLLHGRSLTRTERGTFKSGGSVSETHADLLGFTRPSLRYADVIDMLETGKISGSDMLATLREQELASAGYAVHQDPARGRRNWDTTPRHLKNLDYYDSVRRYH